MKKITQIILLFLLQPCLSHAEWTQLHQAVEDGNLEQAQYLIDEGADVNAAAEDGWTPLHVAASRDHEDIAQLLLDRGAKIDAVNCFGWTPLHEVVRRKNEALVKVFLEYDAKVNVADNHHRTPLHYAAWYGHEALVQLLLDRGAKVNVADEDGHTPLHWAELESKNHTRLLLSCWQKLTKERKDQMYTFLLATHSRLGAESPATKLSTELYKYIWQYIKKPTIAELDQEILQQSSRSWLNNAWMQGVSAVSAIARYFISLY